MATAIYGPAIALEAGKILCSTYDVLFAPAGLPYYLAV